MTIDLSSTIPLQGSPTGDYNLQDRSLRNVSDRGVQANETEESENISRIEIKTKFTGLLVPIVGPND